MRRRRDESDISGTAAPRATQVGNAAREGGPCRRV